MDQSLSLAKEYVRHGISDQPCAMRKKPRAYKLEILSSDHHHHHLRLITEPDRNPTTRADGSLEGRKHGVQGPINAARRERRN